MHRDEAATVAATWIFTGVRPLNLAYSPLRASEPAVLIESVALALEDVELC